VLQRVLQGYGSTGTLRIATLLPCTPMLMQLRRHERHSSLLMCFMHWHLICGTSLMIASYQDHRDATAKETEMGMVHMPTAAGFAAGSLWFRSCSRSSSVGSCETAQDKNQNGVRLLMQVKVESGKVKG
jgi:hypothetical protein